MTAEIITLYEERPMDTVERCLHHLNVALADVEALPSNLLVHYANQERVTCEKTGKRFTRTTGINHEIDGLVRRLRMVEARVQTWRAARTSIDSVFHATDR